MSIGEDVSSDLAAALRVAGLDTVEGAFTFESGSDLEKANLGARRRTRLELTDATGRVHELYLKRYGPGYGRGCCRAALERLWRHGRGLSPAAVEYNNIRAAAAAGAGTMRAVAMGQELSFCGGGRSYVVVTAVRGDALERCAEDFLSRRGESGAKELTAGLAELVGALHGAGYVHRDLYAAHVFLDEGEGGEEKERKGVSLKLIDLARMFRPRWRRRRWLVKDLAQLKYSMPPAWVERWWDAFMRDYCAGKAMGLDAAIDRKVKRMRSRARRKGDK